eukprot:NODE_4432_length_662_cov_68.717781_g3784_i0.p1 GENE.NODE_4432_length_662_cov_68.717781_g3784_i0~~NODE_4432_length_662_cov_68.717781_g3784_i0.p1  ORF type:complete len:198 (-),score=17.22 NODE_4432_length_662_cov_68.717781_g3784_i0:67-618(-)
MAIDLYKKGRVRSRTFRKAVTTNLYHRLLIKLYKFLARRTDAKFNQIVYKRLNQSLTTRYPLSISKLVKIANTEAKQGKILVLIGNVLNDERMLTVPKLRVCALHFSEVARQRIIKAGGEVLTFDQLAKIAPKGENTYLLRGRRSREAMKHFGAPGLPHSSAKPYVGSGGKKNWKERNTGKVV